MSATSNIASELPPRMACLTCFTQNGFEQRMSKRGGIYYVCPLCGLRIFINNTVQAYGLLFWAKALADETLLQTARTDLERALRRRISVPAASFAQPPLPEAPAAVPASAAIEIPAISLEIAHP